MGPAGTPAPGERGMQIVGDGGPEFPGAGFPAHGLPQGDLAISGGGARGPGTGLSDRGSMHGPAGPRKPMAMLSDAKAGVPLGSDWILHPAGSRLILEATPPQARKGSPSPMPTLFLLEDDPGLRAAMDQHLQREGFKVAAFGSGKDAVKALQGGGLKLDVALLDLTLPDMDGVEVLRVLRGGPLRMLPVLLATSRNEDIDRVLDLDLGADDYISKPFSVRELAARVRAILRRAAFIEDTAHGQVITFGGITVNLDHHLAWAGGKEVELTRREFELLAYFLKNPRRALARERILHQVWGLEYLGESRTIDAHVRRVRAKLGA